MVENRIAREVVDCAYHIHRRLGPGLLESVYEAVLARELERRGFSVKRQQAVPLIYEEMLFETAFRADLIVGNAVIVEVKAIEELAPVHRRQVLTYLKLTNLRLGLLLNFGALLIKDGISRVVNNLPDEGAHLDSSAFLAES